MLVAMWCCSFFCVSAKILAAPTEDLSATPELAEANKIEASGDAEKALALYKSLVKEHPFSQKAGEAQFQVARL